VSQGCESDLICPCPPVGLIDVVGKKWAVCVIALLGKYGTVRFGPIQRCLSGVSPATLTTTLRALERARLVHRAAVEGGRGVVKGYALTPQGAILHERITPLADWLRVARYTTPVGRNPPGWARSPARPTRARPREAGE
jgi:DNA-binding HxlR family transcriptional regulator